jgi:uncharacterized protein (DUF433 family)
MHIDRITIKPDVCDGAPTIRGMRIAVSHVLEMLAGGMTPEQVLQDFPYLWKKPTSRRLLSMQRGARPIAKSC